MSTNTLSEMLETRRQAQLEDKRPVQQSRPMRGYANYADSAKSEADYQKDYEKRYNEFQHHNQRIPKGDELDKWYDNHMAKKQEDRLGRISKDVLPSPQQSIQRSTQQRAEKAMKEPGLDESMGGKTKKLVMQ